MNTRTWTILKLLLPVSISFLPARAASSIDLAESFANPPAETRILKIIHNWPEAAEAQAALIRKLTNQGFGGVVCNVSFQDYLESEAKWQAFTRAVQAAKQAGMALWLYDEKGYPSANAGGIVMRNRPEWQARGLLIADTQSQGGAVSLDVPPGELMLASAFPIVSGAIDMRNGRTLTNAITSGKLNWHPPAGLPAEVQRTTGMDQASAAQANQWQVMVITEAALFEGTHAAMNLHAKVPYPNLLLPEVTQRFLEVTHGEYARRMGHDLGKIFEATFTDEPSLMSCFLRPMPYRVLPWSQNLPGEFQKRRGYALEPILPLLIVDADSAEARVSCQKARHDFWLTVGELVSENFFGQIQEWCARHNVPSGGHLLSEENILTHVPFYGDFFRCIRRLDAPSIDILTSLPPDVPWYIARLLASAAELEGKTLVMSETSDHSQRYRPAGDKRPIRTVTEDEIRGTCNRIFVSGVNTITSYYSFAGLSDDPLRRLNEWVGRCGLMLRGGRQVADIAVLYPVESIWTCFVPSRQWANDAAVAARIGNVYRSVSDSLFAARRDFTYVDGRALAEATVSRGELVHGQLRWRAIVLPMADTLPLAAWENLASFVKQGGVVIAVGALPANSEREFPSARVQALASETFGPLTNEPIVFSSPGGGAGVFLPEGSEGLLVGLLGKFIEPDLATGERRSPLRVTHRRKDGRELYFVINDSSEPWQGTLSFRATGPGEHWDLESGRFEPLNSSERLPLSLRGYGAAVFRFAKARAPAVSPLKSGSLPGLTLETLPEATVKVNCGEFVRQELTSVADSRPGIVPISGLNASATDSAASTTVHSEVLADGHRAVGTITKSQVDTYLFIRLTYPAGLDLTGRDSLLLDTFVPEGQRTSTQLLVMLHERDGSDYLAQTGRSLAAAGRNRTFVPFNRFELAGWSQDENHQLDLSSIDEIRIGWGGYFGTENERVEFSVQTPQAGKEIW